MPKYKTVLKRIAERKKKIAKNPEKAERARKKRVERYLTMSECPFNGKHGVSEGVKIDD